MKMKNHHKTNDDDFDRDHLFRRVGDSEIMRDASQKSTPGDLPETEDNY